MNAVRIQKGIIVKALIKNAIVPVVLLERMTKEYIDEAIKLIRTLIDTIIQNRSIEKFLSSLFRIFTSFSEESLLEILKSSGF